VKRCAGPDIDRSGRCRDDSRQPATGSPQPTDRRHELSMRIGIDLGGTKIEVIALAAGGRTLDRRRVPTPKDDYDATITAIAQLVGSLESELGERGTVGVGIPGTISPATGVVKNANSTWLNGRPLDRDLQRTLARPVRLANDANCFALSEATDGAAAGAAIVFGVILGTGTGGGVVIDGRVLTGANAVSGEWGHNPMPAPRDDERPGPPCYCGRSGCIDQLNKTVKAFEVGVAAGRIALPDSSL